MKIHKKLMVMAASAGVMTLGFAGAASAHVTVKPGEITTGTYQTFVVSVPSEKDLTPTVSVKVDIPEGVASVTPTEKPGWTIKVDKTGTGADAKTSAITWSGNTIDAHYRDEFTFSAKTPDQAADLHWKAYQTYQDGTVVSWTQTQDEAKADVEGDAAGPFSITKVVATSAQDMMMKDLETKLQNTQVAAERAMYIGIGGAVLGLLGVILALVAATKHRNVTTTTTTTPGTQF